MNEQTDISYLYIVIISLCLFFYFSISYFILFFVTCEMPLFIILQVMNVDVNVYVNLAM